MTISSIAIRLMRPSDPASISAAFTAQGWNKPREQYERYWQESEQGSRAVLVAERDGVFAGYVTLLWQSDYEGFKSQDIPEIVDFNVLKAFQRQGVGTALMDKAEQRIGERSPIAGLGVGLTPDYGPAQVLYVKRGYVPDGRGIYHNGQLLKHGGLATVDDDLVMYLTKTLR
jgi:GNAT superfamily N-acetyltransferase